MSQDRHPTEDLPAYALGALDKDEREVIAVHVKTCATCSRDLAQFEEALFEAAAIGAVNVDPPTDLRTRIVDRHRGARVPSASRWGDRVIQFLRNPVPAAVPIALAILLIVALGVVGASRQQADTSARALAGVADGRVVALAPQKNAPDARGAVVVPRSGDPYVVLQLSTPPTGKTWEAWVIKGQRPIAAGLSGSGGVFTIVLSAPVGAGDVVAVTLEPAAGSSAPTSDPVLAGGT